MNTVLLTGRLTKDTEVRRTSDDLAIARNSIAVDKGYGDKKKTAYINLVAFGKTAEAMETYTFKGQRVIIDGEITTGSYEKDGRKIYTFDVLVNRIEYIDWKEKASTEKQSFSALEEDIPF